MRVAAIQTQWQEKPEDNLSNVLKAVDEACARAPRDFVILPEFFLGPAWYMPGQADLRGVTDTEIPGPAIEGLTELARRHKCHIICGSVVERQDGSKFGNTSVLVGPDGVEIGQTGKVHPFANETVVFRPVDQIRTFDTAFGKIAIAICSDFWIPETIRILALEGAHTIFVPGGSLRQNLSVMINAFLATAWLNSVNIVYCCPVGKITGIRGNQMITVEFAGTSLIVTPDGLVAEGPADRECVLEADLSTERPLALRRPNDQDDGWISLGARRPAAYGGILDEYVGLNRDLAVEIAERMRQTRPQSATPSR